MSGTVRRLVNEGKTVRAVIMAEGITSRANTREEADRNELSELQSDARDAANIVGYNSIDFCGLPDNRMDGMNLLDVIKIVNKYLDKYEPDTIFTHHHGDLNVDHRITCEAVLTATRPMQGEMVKSIFAFETPSSTEWDFSYRESFKPNVFVDVTDTLDAKIKGMECYRSEKTSFPHPRSSDALRALAQYRGSSSGFEMAEGFILLRKCIDNLVPVSVWGTK